ncbi:protein-disulfide reductase DsbD domain-containing protein [Salinisphaera shabanensis]|nr:protein-disulfide reductase DsbD domain-containing protein [Salinisphaera shabanensis]
MNKDILVRWLVPVATAAVVGGVFVFWQWPAPDDARNVQAASNGSASTGSDSNADIVALYSQSEELNRQAGIGDSAQARQTSSSDHVELSASRQGNNVRVELAIEKPWHINANPASLDFLIPTEVEFTANDVRVPANFDYPAGEQIDVGLGDPIQVYSGRLELITNLAAPDNDRPLKAQARIQACNDSGLCLPPSMLSVRVADSAQSSSP